MLFLRYTYLEQWFLFRALQLIKIMSVLRRVFASDKSLTLNIYMLAIQWVKPCSKSIIETMT